MATLTAKRADNKKQLAREKSIERILESAIYLFSKFGFAQTTMDMIAKHAKLSKGLAYNYFKSKNEIFESIIDDHLTKQEHFYKDISKQTSLKEYVREFFERSLQFAKTEKKTFTLITVCMFQPGSASISRKMLENIDKRLTPFKERMIDDLKKLGVKEPDRELLMIITFLHGILMGEIFDDQSLCPSVNVIDLFLERYR